MATQVLASAFAPQYELQRQLGRGGMATVYLARDVRHGRLVAIKVLHPALAALVGPERFLREIRIAANLQHPHIVPVFDSGRAPGAAEGQDLLWYAMPFVEGESLRDRLSREGALPLAAALRIAREVAEALDYAHRQDVLHRDIKPENILLEDGQAVVADFGIARPIAAGETGITHGGILVGTPAYVSPEQVSGDSPLDGRSDLYSLGCVLFEMLTGTPLFAGPTPDSVIAQRFVPHDHLLDRLPPEVPEQVRGVLARLLSHDPTERYASGAEAAAALSGDGTGPRSRPPVPFRLNGRTIAVASVILLVAAVAVVAALRSRASRTAASGVVPRTVVVLPFTNMGRPDDEYFADGLTEEIAGRLARVPGLRVIARGSAMVYKGSDKPLEQIGKELGAGYALAGSVRWERLAGGRSRIRVTPRLVGFGSGAYLWSDRYDAELADVFKVQADIAEAVAAALDLRLGGDERAALARRPTSSLEAYDAFLRAGLYAERGWSDLGALDSSLIYYRRAVASDRGFAEAWARLSVALTLRFRRTPGGSELMLAA